MFSKKMFAVCLYYAKDYTEAEDFLHDGFMKVFSKISQFKGQGSFEGWVKRIMINTVLEKYRKQHQLYPVDNVFEYMEDISEQDSSSDISFKQLLKFVQELSPQYRLVFNLYAIEGYPHKEIADMLNISVGTSKSNLARARSVLQDKVKKEMKKSSLKQKLVV